MTPEQTDAGTYAADDRSASAREPITVRLIGTAMLAGFVSMVSMLPVLVGIPALLDLFSTDPIVRFASFGSFLGLEPSLAVGAAMFIIGGTLFLPIQFLVVGAYLPPEEPRYARGVTYALIYWIAFVMVFLPAADALAVGVFLVVSLLYHVAYGFALGYLIDRWAEIPQHAV
ncbi:hypothetical protein SAMN06269185_0674 [Natronoarchaeum philippinense]|uniref:Cytochrome C oxidase subunit I n=1 Tax=Natronoarchaeum philippinense TaxID=558529 RepID=A0A285NA13_NATPI|nr:DUF6789 family protein [Natronoarchaeum philippinense]SNZ04776.1 hypothetical protein SAMN06269185_0674 [Natronoarchaeum philippinense]